MPSANVQQPTRLAFGPRWQRDFCSDLVGRPAREIRHAAQVSGPVVGGFGRRSFSKRAVNVQVGALAQRILQMTHPLPLLVIELDEMPNVLRRRRHEVALSNGAQRQLAASRSTQIRSGDQRLAQQACALRMQIKARGERFRGRWAGRESIEHAETHTGHQHATVEHAGQRLHGWKRRHIEPPDDPLAQCRRHDAHAHEHAPF